MNAKRFAEINIGATMVSLTGPGHWPTPEGCGTVGRVEAKIEDKWGRHLKLKCSDGSTKYAEAAYDPKMHKGLGWYLYENPERK